MDPQPFLRGVAFPGTQRVPYPRADPRDARLPRDTWARARIPVGVRLEWVGDAPEVEIGYVARAADVPWWNDGGREFVLWPGSRAPAVAGEGRVRLGCPPAGERAVVYLPAPMSPVVVSIVPIGGTIEPAPPQPRWVCYGDSVVEGWMALSPEGAWPAVAAREQRLDVVNMGYAGAARGELASAEQVASLRADVISITHGTNCWRSVPHSVGTFREGLRVFLDIVRAGHPSTPVLVASPIVRPDAEDTPNRLGATLRDLRQAMEGLVRARGDMVLVEGLALLDPGLLGDGIHPNDEGHRALAAALGPPIAKLVQ